MKTLFLLSLFLLSSCGGDDFQKVETLESFRILGVFSPTPEVAPNVGSVDLQLYVSDVNGAGRSITGTTQGCIDPGIALGAEVSCDHDPSTQNGTYTINTAGMDLFTGLSPDIARVNIPNTILLGRSSREQFNGVGFVVIFRFNVDGKDVTAFKRIVVTNRGPTNTNPIPGTMNVNGAGVSTIPLDGDKLTVSSSGAETYDFRNIDGTTETRTEKFEVAWYVSRGKFDKPKANIDDTVEYQGKPSSDPVVFLAIIRDERGGIEFVKEYLP
jgi:hypothetical protein